MGVILATLVLAATAVVAPPELPSRFVELLERDDTIAVATAAGPDADLASADWVEVRDAVQKYDCIDVRTLSVATESAAEDAVTFRIDLFASGHTAGGIRNDAVLPRVWFVTFQQNGGEWRMTSARTREGRLVDAIRTAPDDVARWDLVRGEEVDLSYLATAVSLKVEREHKLWPFAYALSVATGDLAVLANAHGWAATAFRCDTERAREHMQAALHLAWTVDDPDAIARAAFTSGIVRWIAGDVPAALVELERCASMLDIVRDYRAPLHALHMLVHLELGRGNVTAAVAHAQLNLEGSRKYRFTEGEVQAANAFERIHAYLGNRGESAAASRQVLRGATSIGRKDMIGTALYNLTVSEEEAGNYEEATALLQRAGSSFYGAASRVPEKLGDLLAHQERYDQAEPHYRASLERARTTKDGNAEILMLTNLSRLALRRGRFEEALTIAREATMAKNPSIGEVGAASPWLPRAAEGAALAALGRDVEAAKSFEQALAMIETEKRVAAGEASPAFLDQRIEPFVALVDLHLADGEIAKALSVSERMKARVLRDLLDRGAVDWRRVLTPEQRMREDELNRRLVEVNRAVIAAGNAATAELRVTLDQARAEQRAFAVAMELAYPELRSTVAPPSAAEVREWLDCALLTPSRDSLVLDYVVGERQTTLFALLRDPLGGTEVRVFTLPVAKKDLARSIARLVSQIERRNLGYASAAAELYRQMLAPVEPLLAGAKSVAIVPHGILWQLPFAVLRGPDGRHLIERLSIHYAPSLAYLGLYAGRLDAALPANPRVLALGNPAVADRSHTRVRAFTRASLGDLPEAVEEAQGIGRLYRDANVLVRSEATEEAVKNAAASQDILHFATHGISQPSQPMYSSLVLATKSEREDGLLEAREIVRMNLQAKLAVLSACETARGGIAEGEGVIGLSWAFLVAGCPRAIVTHWRADSAAAAKAMLAFHERVARREGGGSIPGALRDAQLTLLRTPRYSHPYYWAGFVVVGAGW